MNPLWILVLVMPVIGVFALLCLADIGESLRNIENLLNEKVNDEFDPETTKRAHPDCTWTLSSSRMCEHGTKGCDVRHSKEK